MVRILLFLACFFVGAANAAAPSVFYNPTDTPDTGWYAPGSEDAACKAQYPDSSLYRNAYWDGFKPSDTTIRCRSERWLDNIQSWTSGYERGNVNGEYRCSKTQTRDTTKPWAQQCPDADPCSNLTGTSLASLELSVPVAGAHSTPQTICATAAPTGGPNGGALLCGVSYTTKPDGMWAQSPNGQWYFFVYSSTEASKYKYTGSSCTDSGSGGSGSGSSPSPNPTTCASGTCPGTVNGTNVCVPCSGAADEGPKETTTNTDTNGTTTPGETKDSAVTCDGNYCTIKTTSTNPDGSYTTSTKTQDKKSYCEENPTFPACTARWQDKACEAEPVCEGDPIACAQTKLAHKTYCENFVKVTPLSELGTTAANGENFPEGHPRADATTSAFNFAGAFSSSSAGGGGCPADVTVMGVVVPLSSTCDGLNGLGIAALGIALIWAARVVFGS